MTQAPPAPPVEECPRCGADAQTGQEYCLDCGMRLTAAEPGVVPQLAAAWQRRFRWYPGDWIWPAVLGLLLAVAGAAFAILYSHHGGSPKTIVATTSAQSVPTTAPPATDTGGTPPVATPTVKVDTSRANIQPPGNPTTTAGAAPRAAPGGLAQWPAGKNGYTVVIESLPTGGGGAAAALRKARQAAAAGLPEVGVLDSGGFSSLHPGYAVVFSGVYPTFAKAQEAAIAAQAKGFGSAYARQITT